MQKKHRHYSSQQKINFYPPFLFPRTTMRLPRWLSGYRICLQCRRWRTHGFDPWVRKIALRRAWQPTPVFLPGESHGQRSSRLQSMGLQRVRHDGSNLTHITHMHFEQPCSQIKPDAPLWHWPWLGFTTQHSRPCFSWWALGTLGPISRLSALESAFLIEFSKRFISTLKFEKHC